MFPKVRCNGCNKVLGEIWDDFKRDYEKGEDAFEKYNIKRLCCINCLKTTVETYKSMCS